MQTLGIFTHNPIHYHPQHCSIAARSLCLLACLDLEDLLNVGDTKSALERGESAAGSTSEVVVDGLDGDARLGEGKGLADGLDDGGREAGGDHAHELVGQRDATKGRLDLFRILARLVKGNS